MATTTATPPVKYNWNEERIKIKKKFSDFLDKELKVGENKSEENLKILETRIGEIQEELHTIITELK